VRDIGEIAPGLDYAGQPLEYVATVGQPEEENLKRLAEAGYKTVVDLLTPEEHPRPDEWGMVVWRAGIDYVNIPMGHKDIHDKTFDGFRELMWDGGRRPVPVHCSSANRVGAPLIPYLILDESMTPEKAREIAAQVGLRSNRLERAALRYVSVK
jgi:protein tyrosine phosphatase (PTP) superfamily phosphohydrolase (DUF442 family)